MMGGLLARAAGLALAVFALSLGADLADARGNAAGAAAEKKEAARTGIAAKFSLDPVGKGKPSAGILEGEDALVQFQLSDAATHAPIKGVRPAAWMALQKERIAGRDGGKPSDCKGRIRSFLQEGLGFRPEVDLNTYYILTLNDQPSISVIDPLLGMGSSKLVTQVQLKSPGQDWVLSADRKKLYVTLPQANEVAVVDTATWKVVGDIPVGRNPTRLALQPDEKYLWVGNDGGEGPGARGGASVIDTERLKVAAEFPGGGGHHEFAFTGDSRHAFVSNQADGTVSVFDVQKLARLKDLKTGAGPVSLAFSLLSQTLFVAHADGTLAVIDGRTQELSARAEVGPSLDIVRFSPDGRWGFAASGRASKVYVLDASTNRSVRSFDVGPGPDQISFTDDYAYVRSAGTQDVGMIPLSALAKTEAVSVARFPAGQAAPNQSVHPAVADAVVPAPERGAVLVANPADKTIYYYSEGMAAPMGNFQNYGGEPRAVRVLDRSLKEAAPGVYSTTVRLPRSGAYDVALLLDSPRYYECFVTKIESNPALDKLNRASLQIEFLVKERKIRTQEATRLQFRLTDPATHAGKDGLKDVQVQSVLAPGLWSRREAARPVGGGVYESELKAPRAGVYYVYVSSRSQSVRSDKLPYLILEAVDGDKPSEQVAIGKKP